MIYGLLNRLLAVCYHRPDIDEMFVKKYYDQEPRRKGRGMVLLTAPCWPHELCYLGWNWYLTDQLTDALWNSEEEETTFKSAFKGIKWVPLTLYEHWKNLSNAFYIDKDVKGWLSVARKCWQGYQFNTKR